MYAKAIGDSCLFIGMSLMTYVQVTHDIRNDWIYFVGLGIAAIGHFASGLIPREDYRSDGD